MMFNFNFYINLLAFTTTLFIVSCGVYSFTGSATTAKTFTIHSFYNDTNNGPSDLSILFTNKLQNYYERNTNLTHLNKNGELEIEGTITNYSLSPVAPSSAAGNNEINEQANLTRLTITLKVDYLNITNEEESFKNKNFSFYADFDNNIGLTAVENQLIEEIYEQLILDIFNSTVANW